MAAVSPRIRPATAADVGAVAGLAEGLAQSFAFARASFDAHYPALLAAGHACLLVAVTGADADSGECVGYLLGFEHLTFYANGRVAWVEEVFVRGDLRGRGVGRALMAAFEGWAAERGCALVALATRRAAPFYHALGYEDSATYLRKLLPGRG
jgi:GNAT superfamily N-acetyltransferase